jgi:hypothetical protein
MKRMSWAIALALPLLGTPVFANEHGEHGEHHKHESVKMEDLPPAVQDTLRKEANGGKIGELRKEKNKQGAVIYEAEIVKDGKGTDLEVDSSGKVVERGQTHDESQEHEHGKK